MHWLCPTRPMPQTAALTLLRWLPPVALAAAVLGWLLHGADVAALLRQGSQVPGAAWLMASAALSAGYLCRAQRVKDEWHRDSLLDCWKLVMLHNLAVLWLPLRAGEAGYVYLVHRRFGAGLGAAACSLLLLRLQDAVVLCLLALLLAAHWAGGWPLATGVAVLLVAALALRGWPERLQSATQPVTQRWPALAAALTRPPSVRSWGLSATNWVLKLAALGGLLAQLLPLTWTHTLRGALAGELAGALPVQGPAGLGTYEAAVWAGSQLGLSAHQAAPAAALAPGQVALAALCVHSFALACSLAVTAVVHVWPLPRPISPRPAR